MPRRRIAEDPTSRLAIWARRLALFALAVALLAIVVVRLDFIEIVPGLATFGGAVGIAVIAMLFAVGAFIVIWREGLKGFGHALLAFVIGIVLVTYPAYLGAKAYRLPPLADITTDMTDPPRFEAIARLRPREANPVAYPGAAAAELQRATYPQIAPLQTASTPAELYEAALSVVSKRKWRVIETRSPQVGRREGRIEAVARTALMGFRDDIVIRVRPISGGARLDIRSASRYGQRDFGANAQRVLGLLEDIEDAATPQPETRR
ncbi:MAG: DUF1499 domain-containing protein [Xanthobacteraceae bacterium]